jgi:hypothetical protein
VELGLFDLVGEGVRTLVPEKLGEVRFRAHRYGVKVWLGTAEPPREHYEAQVVGPRDVPSAKTLAVDVGFHSEHPKPDLNAAVLDHLRAKQATWRKALGDEAELGPFLGRRTDWGRVSETWLDPDLSEEDLSFELAARLTDYITALEPVLRKR